MRLIGFFGVIWLKQANEMLRLDFAPAPMGVYLCVQNSIRIRLCKKFKSYNNQIFKVDRTPKTPKIVFDKIIKNLSIFSRQKFSLVK